MGVETGPNRAAPPVGDALPPRQVHRARPSHIALKATMAVSGSIMAAFVIAHMVGNLKAFMGPEDYNSYARFLRTVLYPLLPYEGVLWILRVVLLACLVAHTTAGIMLWRRGRRARGSFGRQSIMARSWATRTMILSGAVVLVFIVVHLLDLTIGRLVASSAYQAPVHTGPHEVEIHAYENLVASLSRPGMALFYTAVMLVISIHLAQGLWNVLHDLGGTAPRLRRIWLALGLAAALAVAVLNGMLPLLVLAGVIS
ncbi:succinate dehydrogenase cytochrome b subunit [Actinomyces oricola]|uniref:succinate dehydrogenase cytochrome b subunit n=1 Tax=Actinomyces oricola TaxID=206043 RepID=UPI000FFEF771|nr:succinate dehydrogenase cytochrome b subunit [Actinomyces oricola]